MLRPALPTGGALPGLLREGPLTICDKAFKLWSSSSTPTNLSSTVRCAQMCISKDIHQVFIIDLETVWKKKNNHKKKLVKYTVVCIFNRIRGTVVPKWGLQTLEGHWDPFLRSTRSKLFIIMLRHYLAFSLSWSLHQWCKNNNGQNCWWIGTDQLWHQTLLIIILFFIAKQRKKKSE